MRRLALASVAAVALVLPLVATATSANAARPPAPLASPTVSGQAQANAVRVCPAPPNGYASCFALLRTDSKPTGPGKPGGGGKPSPSPSPTPTAGPNPSGYGPKDIQSAYNLPAFAGTDTPTVAIVDAYDDPTAEADLAVYRTQYGLPECSTSNGCFKKMSQTGGTNLPRVNGGWAQEISLDLDMVSAACPDCNILLVEAKSASFADLGAAVDTAAKQRGVVAISNSYGGSDYAQSSIPGYDHPGIAITASTGDNGYGVSSPASFPTVIAVGGTTLKNSSTTGWTQTAWSGAGSGCSTKNAKPAWQTDVTLCSGKANADVSAVADPKTGVAVYDSTAYQGYSGWLVFGGTSVSSPIVASVYALGGNHGESYPAAYTWRTWASAALTDFRDPTTGSNGTCSTSIWCNAQTGWDGPTGLGTPNGTGAF